ncbi:MAG: hypothetical protein EBT44_07085 [Actinobacteria bacterium]|jgi:hypothetical protein|uniref:Uncharacterized protein n=1 Tax=Candidatus Fonsibacter lacus TaxID=2576439 RepID=A0A965GEF5_9PROT|nr:hypothetical protein [Candidatus Fonsibacter lacus]
MTPIDWATFAVAVTTLLGTLAVVVRHLVKHYLSELRPNGGSSLKDKVNQLDDKVEFLTELIIQSLKK